MVCVNSCNNNRLLVQCEKSFSLYIYYKDHENECFEKYSITFHGQTEIDTVSHDCKYTIFQLSLLSLVWINKPLQLVLGPYGIKRGSHNSQRAGGDAV